MLGLLLFLKEFPTFTQGTPWVCDTFEQVGPSDVHFTNPDIPDYTAGFTCSGCNVSVI